MTLGGRWVAAVAVVALAAALTAPAGAAQTVVGGGIAIGERGAGAAAIVEARGVGLVWSLRADYGVGVGGAPGAAHGGGLDATALVGLGPSTATTARAPATTWDQRCVATLAAGDGHDRCWLAATAAAPIIVRTRPRRRWAMLGGARVGTGGFGSSTRGGPVVAGRWYLGDRAAADPAGSLVEFGVAAVLAGRDRPFLKHAAVMPGWYARVQLRYRLLFTAELGVTGLGYRDRDGGFRPELYGRTAVLFTWGS